MHDTDFETQSVIARICNSDSPEEAFILFSHFEPLLNGWKFVLGSEIGSRPGFAINRTFASGSVVVRSLFRTSKIFVLDQRTVRDMANGRATFGIDYSISLETQALSYLAPYLDGRTSLPAGVAEMFSFIARDDVYVDPLPYQYENIERLSSPYDAEKIFEKLKAYEVLRTLDVDRLRRRGEIRSTLSDMELVKATQENIGRLLNGNDSFVRALKLRHSFFYALLLKMADIQITNARRTVNDKLFDFLYFCDTELAAMCARESVIARRYFEQGQKLSFFGKIQKGRSGLFEQLKNMAWDLMHVRHLEHALTISTTPEARYFIPALLTFDRGLIEIMDLYPLKACAFLAGGPPIPFYDGDPLAALFDDPMHQDQLKSQFYSRAAISSRSSNLSNARARMAATVAALEDRLANSAAIATPGQSVTLQRAWPSGTIDFAGGTEPPIQDEG